MENKDLLASQSSKKKRKEKRLLDKLLPDWVKTIN